VTIFTIFALAGAMFILAITPGPGVFATIARALASGFSHATVLIAGIVLGDLIFLLLAIYGLAAVADFLGGFFAVVKYAGGLYLIWLGWRIWHSAGRAVQVTGVKEFSWRANFISGLVITLGNPKVILFYLGFLPTFVDLTALTHLDVLIAALVVSLVLAGVLLGYAYTAARARNAFTSGRAARRLNKAAGGVMMSTGVVLIAKT